MKKSVKTVLIVIVAITALGAISAMFSKNDPKNDSKTEVKSEKHTAKCDFTKATLTLMEWGSEKVISKQAFEGCFTKTEIDKQLEGWEIASAEHQFKVMYYNDTPMRFLNVRIGEADPTEWRKNKGHDIFKIEKDNKLTFIFGDKKKTKGTVVFE